MDTAKITKRISNLNKVRAIVEIAKFDTLKKISEAKKIKDHHYEMANMSQEIISYAKSKNKVSNKIIEKLTSNKNTRTLWVFVTIPSKLISVSYSRFENIIKEGFNITNDSIVCIGDPSINFAKKEKYNISASFQELENASDRVVSLIIHSINEGQYDSIKIVSHSIKKQDEAFEIFPIKDNEFNAKKMKKTKFYYSILEIMDNISFNYVKNIVDGIFQETYKNFYSEKLARHETSLKNIDEKSFELNMQLVKGNRKEETEEMIQVIQGVKRR